MFCTHCSNEVGFLLSADLVSSAYLSARPTFQPSVFRGAGRGTRPGHCWIELLGANLHVGLIGFLDGRANPARHLLLFEKVAAQQWLKSEGG
jgi:hypothetical protein